VPIVSRLALLLAALVLCAPGLAIAQTSTISDDGAGVSTQPPVELGNGDEGSAESTGSSASGSPSSELPNTGSDPRLLLLAGVALLLAGVGLRLRTADAELY
jgi:LPXTG-motif cell wall-anchored protein